MIDCFGVIECWCSSKKDFIYCFICLVVYDGRYWWVFLVVYCFGVINSVGLLFDIINSVSIVDDWICNCCNYLVCNCVFIIKDVVINRNGLSYFLVDIFIVNGDNYFVDIICDFVG